MNGMSGKALQRALGLLNAALGVDRQIDRKGCRRSLGQSFWNRAYIERMRVPADTFCFTHPTFRAIRVVRAPRGAAMAGQTDPGGGVARRHFSGPEFVPGGFVRHMAGAAGS